MSQKPVVLMVLDGYGISEREDYNAIAMAKTPVMDKLKAECPFVLGSASGLAVGLPDGQMGNSEVGHMNIGSGRIIYQDLTLITKYIEDGVFFENEELLRAINNCKEKGSDLHIWGLLSDGGVHSHNTHLYALIEMCKRTDLRTYMFIPSSTDVILPRHPARNTSRSSSKRWTRSASARLLPCPEDIMRWTGTITGTVSRRHMTLSL